MGSYAGWQDSGDGCRAPLITITIMIHLSTLNGLSIYASKGWIGGLMPQI